jgi:Amt family ammonium transporter
MGYVFLGGMILWLGWFGFNPGSTMAVDPEAIARIAVATNLSACAGTLVATFYAWWRHGKPDFSLTVNGCLAGLVAITAPCAYVTPRAAILIGAIAGVLVIEAVQMFDRLRVDDPVGATSVHLVNGIFGTACVGLFGVKGQSGLPHDGLFRGGGFAQLGPQLEAVVAVGAFSFGVSLAVWWGLKKTMGLRVSADDESVGLDVAEMGMEAYPESPPAPEQVPEVG